MLNRVRQRLHLQGWRLWLLLVVCTVGVRALLPVVIRRVASAQASKLLHARVDIGDVDLALLRGGIALKDVAIRPPTDEAEGAAEKRPDTAPLIAWRRFAVEVHYLPLLRRVVQLRSIELDSPYVALERLANGELNLMQLLPATSAAPKEPNAAPAQESRWQFGGDRILLKQGKVRFQDFMMRDSEPVELSLDAIEITDIQMKPGVYGEPAHMHVDLKVDEAVIGVDASLQLGERGMTLETDLKASRAPLRRARVYIPSVGWRELHGELDADLVYRLETGGRNELRGSVSLRDVTVEVPGIDTPVLAWKRLVIQTDPLDLAGRRLTLSSVDLEGAKVLVRLHDGMLLPVLAPFPSHDAAAASVPPVAAPPAAVPPAAVPPAAAPLPQAAPPTESPKPWGWSISTLKIDDSLVHLMGTDLDVGVKLGVQGLASEGDASVPVQLTVTIGEGSLRADGQFRLSPPGFAGKLAMDKLDVPRLVNASGAVAQNPLQAAQLGGDLTIAAGSMAPTPGDLSVRGTISLAEPRVAVAEQEFSASARRIDVVLDEVKLLGLLPDAAAGPVPPEAGNLLLRGKITLADPQATATNPKGGTAGAHSIELTLGELTVSGLLAKTRPASASGDVRARGELAIGELHIAGADPKEFAIGARAIELPFEDINLPAMLAPAELKAAAGPMQVRLGDIRLTAPTVRVTRTSEGLVLPQFAVRSSPAPAQPQSPSAPAEGAGVAVSASSFRITTGHINFSDRAVKPVYTGEIAPLNVELRGVRFPALAVERVKVDAMMRPEGTLTMTGGFSSQGGTVEVDGESIDLGPFNSYAVTFSPYSIAGGTLSVSTKASFKSGGYQADTSLTLHDFDLGSHGGESLFQEHFGIPLSVGLSLLRDVNGNIILDIPIETDEQGTKVGLTTIIAGALRRALVNALAAPLKLVGAIFSGEKVQAIAPTAMAFRLGRPEPTQEGTEQLKRLGMLLASRPGLGVTVDTAPSTHDARWLREQDLAAELGKPQGLFARVRTFTQRGARDAIRGALAARAEDRSGELDRENSETLERWLNERPSISPERLRALADARLGQIEALLREQHGVAAERITRGEPVKESTEDMPVVHLQLGPVRSTSTGSTGDQPS